MSDVHETVEAFLSDHPGIEEDMQAMLTVDAEGDPWEFHDVPLDSGAFGELVSRGVVEKRDGGYRLADPKAVAIAIGAEVPQVGDESESDGGNRGLASAPDVNLAQGLSIPDRLVTRFSVNRERVAVLAGLLVLMALFRMTSYLAVFRNGDVVLSGNDPYYYRYWVETLLARSNGGLEFGVLSDLPGAIANGEPLMVATLWGVAALLGGGKTAAGQVLAWYPVVSAVVTGVFVYLLGTYLFDDRRVGWASVVMLALVPVHAFRTSLGFADHHAFDYPWLALTMGALVMCVDRSERGPYSWQRWLGGGVLGIAVAGQTLAWEAGPLLLGAIGAAVAILVIADVRASVSPLATTAPILGGLGLGTVLAAGVHSTVGWHTEQVAYAPALVLGGVIGLVLAAEVVHRLSLPAVVLVAVEGTGVAVAWIGLQTVLPEYAARLAARVETLITTRNIVETVGLIGPGAGFFGPIFLFGLLLFLSVPYVAWATWQATRSYRPAWVIAIVYWGYFFALSLLQIRFAGEFAPALAVFAGLGLVHLAARTDIAAPSPIFAGDSTEEQDHTGRGRVRLPERGTIVNLVVLVLLVGSLSIVQVPLKTNQLTIDTENYRAAKSISADAADRDLGHPQNYVLSQWGRNRMYNYFVSGESRSYGYARSNFGAFLTAGNGEEWYRQHEGRVGYVVLERNEVRGGSNSLPTRLFHHYGSRGEEEGLAHYRAVYVAPDGSLKAFALVPGATLAGTLSTNASVTVSTRVRVGERAFDYTRRVRPDPGGKYSVTVPYPGAYTIGEQTVRVSSTAIYNGTTISVVGD